MTDLSLLQQVHQQALALIPSPVLAVALEDGELIIKQANQAFADIVGCSLGGILNASFTTYFTVETWRTLWGRMRSQEGEQRLVGRLVTCYGETKNVEVRFAPSASDEMVGFTAVLSLMEPHQPPPDYLRVIYAANLNLSRNLQLGKVLESLLQHLYELVPYDTANIMLFQPNGSLSMAATHGYEAPEKVHDVSYRLEDSPILMEMVDTHRAKLISDTMHEPAWIRPEGAEHVRCWVGAPLIVSGEVIGVFGLDKSEPCFFEWHHVHLAESLAIPAAIAIENARLHGQVRRQTEMLEERVAARTTELMESNKQLQEEVNRRRRTEEVLRRQTGRLQALRQLGFEVSSELNLPRLLRAVLNRSVSLLDASAGALFLIEEKEGEPVLKLELTYKSSLPIGMTVRRGHGVAGWAWESQDAVVSNHYAQWENRLHVREVRAKAAVAVPMQWGEEILGVITVANYESQSFTDADVELINDFAMQAAVAVQNAHLHQQIHHYAETLERRVHSRTKQLTAANRQLREMDRLKNKLISDISHELRTPLANIGLYLDLLEKRPQKHDAYMRVLRNQLGRLSTLLEDVAQVSYLDQRRESVEHKHVDLGHVFQQLSHTFRSQAEDRGLSFSITTADNLPTVWGDDKQLEDMIVCLLDNAFKYTKDGEIAIIVTAAEGEVIITVTDTGVGISEEDLPHLYEPFYRGRAVSNVPGTGIGLTVVREIVAIHNGRIEIESEPGTGTRVRVVLPVRIMKDFPSSINPEGVSV